MIRKAFVILGNIGVIAVFVIGISIMAANRPQPERGTPQSFAPTVFVEEVSYRPVRLTVRAQGEVRPKQEINLTTQVGGKITAVASQFVEGGTFSEGDVLVKIEDADYRLAVTRARARVASARQSLEIEKAEAELAAQDYEELSGLEGGDEAPSALTLRRPQLARAEADYSAALADLQDAELALSRTALKAPFEGRVRTIAANVGQFVGAGSQLGRIFSTNVALIRLPLTDEDLARLSLPLAFNDPVNGPPVELSAVVAGKPRNWQGRVARVDAAVDASTRQISAIVEVANPYGAGADEGFPLAVGLFVDASIEGPLLQRATVIPRIALQGDGTVYTLDDENRLVLTPVQVAATTGAGVVVIGGLEEGQRLVVSRVTTSTGTVVRPLDPNDPTADPLAAADKPAADTSGTTTAQSADGATQAGTQQ